MNILSLWR